VALDEVVPTALATISGIEARVTIDVPPTLPLVRADAGLLERAIANIVANAARFTPVGDDVCIAAVERAGGVELRVVDHGPGLAPADRQRVFEPFQRLGDHASGEGVGLGLSVAKGMVEAMGGTLTVEDTAGGGLTMVLTLGRANGG
jgi:two-component system sensor histidine kinase KdpD